MYKTKRKAGDWVEIRARDTGRVVRVRCGPRGYEVDAPIEHFEVLPAPRSVPAPAVLPETADERRETRQD